MKRKGLFFASALILFGLATVNSVMAQNVDNVTVSLKFKPVQTITVNTSQEEINFVYDSEAAYTSGVTVANQIKHLKVFSSGGFDVTVRASDVNFSSDNVELTIPVNHITVKPSKNADNPKNTYKFTSLSLSNSDQTIISSTGGGKGLEFDVEYDNTMDVNNDDYIALGYNKNYLTGDATVFSTTLTYMIVAN